MKKTAFLFLSFLAAFLSMPVSLAFGGGPYTTVTLNFGDKPFIPQTPPPTTPPVIVPTDPTISPASVPLVDFCTTEIVNAQVSLWEGNASLYFDRAVNVAWVSLTNQNTGSSITRDFDGSPRTAVGMPMPTSNGLWQICVYSTNGRNYVGYFVVNSSAYGPQLPIGWFTENFPEGF